MPNSPYSSDSSSAVRLEGVVKKYRGHAVLQQVSLKIERGEFLTLLGPSGCGKTTLLNLIAGFADADDGEIFIDDTSVTALPPYQRQIGIVFQNYALFPHMTVERNIAYGLRMRRVPAAEIERRVREAMALVKLDGLGERKPRELSGGQQQRVALARAIVNQPKLLLLDEPLSALDLKLRKRMQLELKHLQAKLGIAFIFVTHDQEEAMTMADRVVVMHAGRIEQVGAGTDIYRQPATRFVAEFIGDANFMAFTSAGDDRLQLDAQGLRVPLGGKPAPARGVAVLRPEDLRLSAEASGHTLTGAVTDVINVGSHSMIHVDIGGQSVVARHGGIAPAELRPGKTVHLAFAPEHLHLIGEQP